MATLRVGVVPVTPFSQNCTLLWDDATKEAVVIDPGGDVPNIVAAIGSHDLDVCAIWLTHGHLDHAGGVMELRDHLAARPDSVPVPIVGPDQRDAMLLENLQRQGEMFGMRGLRNVLPDRWLTEGEKLSIGPHEFHVLHCPGHTPGHVVFVNHAVKIRPGRRRAVPGLGRPHGFSIRRPRGADKRHQDQTAALGDDYNFICGHGPNSTFGAERKSNPFIQ